MTTLATQQNNAHLLERVVIEGDLGQLSPADRVNYYAKVCESVGLNPFSKPFDYIKLNGKLVLYAKRDCTDQLRSIRGISVTITSREFVNDLYVVTARATIGERSDESIGAVSILGQKGEMLANSLMKAETKAKRRVTLSIAGLGWLDETEVATVPSAQAVHVDQSTGEIIDAPTPAKQANAARVAPPQPSKPAPAPVAPTKAGTCPTHGTADGQGPKGRIGHPIKGTSPLTWCWADERKPAQAWQPEPDPAAELQSAVEGAGYKWADWQMDTLGMPYGSFVLQGGTLEQAFAKLQAMTDSAEVDAMGATK